MDGSRRLAQVFVELADTLVDEFDLVDFLQMLTERCVETLAVDAAGLMLADQRGSLRLLTSTSQQSQVLELFELQIEQGPCVDCYATGQPVTNVMVAAAERRWPVFAVAAAEVGFATTHALPMRLRSQVIGALNLFTAEPVMLSETDLAVGQAMADIATIGLLHERTLREQTVLAEQLQSALHSRVLIEQAKGVLAERAGIDLEEAFVQLRAHARRHRLKLAEVATSLIEGTIDARALLQT